MELLRRIAELEAKLIDTQGELIAARDALFQAALVESEYRGRLRTLERELASKQSVIEALQANIADLTRPTPEYVLPDGSIFYAPTPSHNATLTIGNYEATPAKPAIPSAALLPAKLPRFF